MEKSNSLLQKYKSIQSHIDKDRLIKTSQLKELKLHYKDISALVENKYMQKIKHGYYQLTYDMDNAPYFSQFKGGCYNSFSSLICFSIFPHLSFASDLLQINVNKMKKNKRKAKTYCKNMTIAIL